MFVTGPRQSSALPAPLVLCGADLPWVTRCEHLGAAVTADGLMDQDCRERRAEFIDRSVKIREMFSFAHPLEVISAIDKYCCSWYGSNLWDMESSAVESVCAA